MFHVEPFHITRQHVSRETFSRVDELIEEHRTLLEDYLDRLFWWNRRVNLVSRNVPRGTVWEHLRHSLLLTQFDQFRAAEVVVDAGTGGGLPGIPLAVVAPDKHFLLNDIVSKKVIAVRQMAFRLGLQNVTGVDDSIADLELPPISLIVSKHAFKINDLWKMVRTKNWSSMVFYKGLDFEEELEGIGDPLEIESWELSSTSEFYRGKALVFVDRG